MDNSSIMGGQENILPEAANLFTAMRSMGYEDTAAIADLIDNSIDAKANNIWITIDDNLDKIFIADDGVGMSLETLNTAIKLGGKKKHDTTEDLGKYGLGLITASLSMGRTIRIITKYQDEFNTAVLSYDKIQKTNKFIADFYKSTGNEKMSFNFRTHGAETGTVLIIEDCDHIQYKTASSFVAGLTKTVSETFRAFIAEGKRIFINDNEVQQEDPLYLNYDGTKILVDTDIQIKKPDGIPSTMHIRAAAINDFGAAMNKKLHINIYRQGFYILRNFREVAAALEFPEVFKKHNDFNLLRIELSFNSELDDMMGINIRKHNIAPSKDIINELKTILEEPIKKVRAMAKAKQKGHSPIPTPTFAPTFTPVSAPVSAPVSPAPTVGFPVGGQTTDGDNSPIAARDYDIDFKTFAGKEDGLLFESSVSDNMISIRYNVKNMFYIDNIINDMNGDKIKSNLDIMIKASVKAYIEQNPSANISGFIASLAKYISSKE